MIRGALGFVAHLVFAAVVVHSNGLGKHLCTQVLWALGLALGLGAVTGVYNWGAATGGDGGDRTRYGDPAYWEERYAAQPEVFEWYEGYDLLRETLLRALPRGGRILEVGCGNSELALRLVMDGYRSVLGVDIAPAVVAQMQERHGGVEGLSFEVGDVRDLGGHRDGSFAGAVDKGTLDALLCGPKGGGAGMLAACHRLLRPGGGLVVVSNGRPRERLPLLGQLPWADVEVWVAPDRSLSPEGKKEVIGPLDPKAALGRVDLPAGGDTHYIYCCTR